MNSSSATPQRAKVIAIAVLGGLLPIIFHSDSYVVLLLCTTAISIIVISGARYPFRILGADLAGACQGSIASEPTPRPSFPGISAFRSSRRYFSGEPWPRSWPSCSPCPPSSSSHHFLALVTISFGQLVYLFVSQARDLTEGYSGMNFIPRPKFGSFDFESNVSYFYLVYGILLLLLALKQRLVGSRTGRAFVAIREDTHAANGMGVHVTKYKTMAFAISAFYTGVAGALVRSPHRIHQPREFHPELVDAVPHHAPVRRHGQFLGPPSLALAP